MVAYSFVIPSLVAFQGTLKERRHGAVMSFSTSSSSPSRTTTAAATTTTTTASARTTITPVASSPLGDDDKEFIQRELTKIESLEEILKELEEFDLDFYDDDNDDDYQIDDDDELWDEASLEEVLGSLSDDEEAEYDTNYNSRSSNNDSNSGGSSVPAGDDGNSIRTPPPPLRTRESAARNLERALLEGVVPVSAGVGSDCLAGDFGFDPLGFADRDLFRPVQRFLLDALPQSRWGDGEEDESAVVGVTEAEKDDEPRPKALVLRDYREAEIRHSRLAMLAAVFWPLQEMLDRFVLDKDQFGPLIYGPVTLPYFPLIMTAIMLLLGYLDIYSQAIKDVDQIGEAFLPGDCFWDPLQILQGSPDSMKRNMQERELFNGRAAMLACASFTLEEAVSHRAVVDLDSNALLFTPAYQVPFIQQWLDEQFALVDHQNAADSFMLLYNTVTDPETVESLLQSTMLLFLM
jgi:Chlorophyll A-B binding protein